MAKRMILMLTVTAVVIGALGFIKFSQIQEAWHVSKPRLAHRSPSHRCHATRATPPTADWYTKSEFRRPRCYADCRPA